MYEINVSTRRVTQYIIEEAYKWLYQKITNGEYSANRCRDGKVLLLQIAEERAVTESTYNRFVGLFDNSPFSYMMYREKRKSSHKITTDVLCNYFVQYNGTILPLGFIKDFFEDDYETQQEVRALLERFGKGSKEDIVLSWRRTLLNKERAIDHLQTTYPGMLKLHPTLLITQLIRLVVTGVMTALLFISLNSIYFWNIAQTFVVKLKFDFYGEILADATINAYSYGNRMPFCLEGQRFTMADYISSYGLLLVVCLVLTLMLISRYQKLIQFLIFLSRMVINNIQLVRQRVCISKFEKHGIDKIGDYYLEIIPSMAKTGMIQDEHSAGVPGEKKMYNTIVAFDHQNLSERFAKLITKYYELKFTYEPQNIHAAKAYWRKGIVFSIILTVILIAFMVPGLFTLIMSALV